MRKRTTALVPLVAAVFALIVWPLAVLAFESAHATSAARITLENYRALILDPLYRRSFLNSLGLSVAVAALSTALCLGPAWLFVRKQFRGKRLLRALFTLPMSFSGIIVGFLAVIMLGRIGFIPQISARLTGRAWLSGAAYQFSGLVIAYLYFEIPRATLTLESALRKFDIRLEDAAKTLGAGRWQRLAWVMAPLMAPAMFSTFAVTFSVSLGSFGVALILSRRFSVLPVELFQQLVGYVNFGLASAMGLVLAGTAFVVNYAMRRLADERSATHA